MSCDRIILKNTDYCDKRKRKLSLKTLDLVDKMEEPLTQTRFAALKVCITDHHQTVNDITNQAELHEDNSLISGMLFHMLCLVMLQFFFNFLLI